MRNTVIIEDEPLTAMSLKEMVEAIDPETRVIAILQSVEQSVEWFAANDDYQLVFMDIQVADGIVFDLFETTEIHSPIIFTTAYDQYAIQAFKVNSIDYLLKPVSYDELVRSLSKLRKMESYQESTHERLVRRMVIEEIRAQVQGGVRCFLSSVGDQLIPVSTDDTAYYIVDKHILMAVDYSDRHYRLDYTMDEIEGKLDPRKFYQANRQYIVSHKAIKEIYLGFGGKLELRLNVPTRQYVVVSRTKAKDFKRWYAGLGSV